MPYSTAVELQKLSLEDSVDILPVRPDKKLLTFGDLITQGYDAMRPPNRYVARLADMLPLEVINKGISGARFFPAVAKMRDDIELDYITVAYATNDWSGIEEEVLWGIRQKYTNSKIFAITPIWRKDRRELKNRCV